MNDTIQNEAPMHKYFTMMLNMAEEDLDPFQYRLLAHYVRWSSEGPLSEGIRTTAKKCQMSAAKMQSAREALVKAGYLRIIPPTKKGQSTTVIVIDRWAENIARFTKQAESGCTKYDTPEKGGCIKSSTPSVSDIAHIEEQVEEPRKTLFASPHGNAAGDASLSTLERNFFDLHVTVDEMLKFPDAPYKDKQGAIDYLIGLHQARKFDVMDTWQDVLAIVKQALIAPPVPPAPEKPMYDKPARPGNVSDAMYASNRKAYALGAALDKVVADADIAKYKNEANKLINSGITMDMFPDYVEAIRKVAKRQGGWDVTVTALTSNGRITDYLNGEMAKLEADKPKREWGGLEPVRPNVDIS